MKKFKFITITKKQIIIFICVILSLSAVVAFPQITSNASPKTRWTIAIDAGHGGRDGGCVGTKTKVKESDLALSITKKLQKQLLAFGFNVVLTRKDSNGLYGDGNNKKQQDMEARKKIINKSGADCLVSIHLNSFSSGEAKGAQAFYFKDGLGKNLATTMQDCLTTVLPNAKPSASEGDYYILNCCEIPSVLVECGYLSNEEEEALLITSEYQERVAYSIFCGIVKFFNYSYC